MRLLKISLPFVAALILLSGCDKAKVYEKYKEIPGGIWAENQPVDFDIDIADTIPRYNVVMNVRNATSYPFQNLYLFMSTTYPDGTKSMDTLEFYLLADNGKPLGDCSGDLCDSKFRIMDRILFPMKGMYRFSISQAMRTADGNLPYIMDLGMRVEKSDTQ